MGDLRFEIINHIGDVSTSSGGWKVELNRVSWGGMEPKYDLRSWSPNHEKMGKGITLTDKDLVVLSDILSKEVELIKAGLA